MHGLDIPMPSSPKQKQMLIFVPAAMAAKAGLYLANERSRAVKCATGEAPEVRRMLDPKHATKLSRIELALEKLGRRLVIAVEDAA